MSTTQPPAGQEAVDCPGPGTDPASEAADWDADWLPSWLNDVAAHEPTTPGADEETDGDDGTADEPLDPEAQRLLADDLAAVERMAATLLEEAAAAFEASVGSWHMDHPVEQVGLPTPADDQADDGADDGADESDEVEQEAQEAAEAPQPPGPEPARLEEPASPAPLDRSSPRRAISPPVRRRRGAVLVAPLLLLAAGVVVGSLLWAGSPGRPLPSAAVQDRAVASAGPVDADPVLQPRTLSGLTAIASTAAAATTSQDPPPAAGAGQRVVVAPRAPARAPADRTPAPPVAATVSTPPPVAVPTDTPAAPTTAVTVTGDANPSFHLTNSPAPTSPTCESPSPSATSTPTSTAPTSTSAAPTSTSAAPSSTDPALASAACAG